MISFNNKLKEDASKALVVLMINIILESRDGGKDMSEQLGIDVSVLRDLETLKTDDLTRVANQYVRTVGPLSIFNIDFTLIRSAITNQAAEAHLSQLADDYLKKGACKNTMKELFGWRSTQVTHRRKIIEAPVSYGRGAFDTTEEQDLAIYQLWIDSLMTPDPRVRYLSIAVKLGLSVTTVYRNIKLIEEAQVGRLAQPARIEAIA